MLFQPSAACFPRSGRMFAAVLCLLLLRGLCNASPPANYYLVWSDEFQGSSLDTGKWVYWLYPGNYKDATLAQNAFSESGDHQFQFLMAGRPHRLAVAGANRWFERGYQPEHE